MNKRIITAIAVFMVVCMMFTACTKEEPVHNHTFDSTKWVSDATMHWHAATCEHSSERADIQGHIDENIDGICDVCAYAAAHTHAFEEEWSYDATNHWHASTCFHNVIDASAAHTPDEMGFCSVCGYKVSDPDVSTVDKAIDVGVAQKETIKHGTITTADGMPIDFEYRNGYLYVKEGTTEYFYTLTENDQVFAVVRANAWGEVTIYRDTLATTDNLEGPVIPNGFINNAINFYGAEDLVSYLYQMASVDNANGDFAESVADGVYTFSFGYYIEYYGLYVITVEFTLDETTYAISSVNVESKQYATENLDIVTEATAEMPATYAPKSGAEANHTYTLAIKQGIDAENPFKPSDLLATGFDLMDAEGNVYNGSVNIEQKENLSVFIGNLIPDTAMIEFIMVEVSGENVNLDWSDGLNAYAYDGYISLSTSAPVGTVFTLNVSVNGVVKTYTITVVEPVPSSITAGVLGEEWGNVTMNPTNKLEMEQGANEVIGAYLDKVGEIVITVSPETTLEDDKKTTFSMYDLVADKYVKGISYNLSGLPAGEYVFTFTYSGNAELTASITVTVKEKTGSNPGTGDSFVTPTGSGVQTDPFIITQSGAYKANVAADSEVFFAFTATQNGTVKFEFTGSNSFMSYGTFSFMLCDKRTETSMTLDMNAGQILFMKISTYDGSAGEVAFTITVPGASEGGSGSGSGQNNQPASGSGTKADPYTLTDSGKYVATVVQDGEVFYTFKVTKDGKITLNFEGNNWNYSYGTFSFDLCNMGINPSVTFDVKAGDTVYIKVGAYNVNGTVDITFTFTVE